MSYHKAILLLGSNKNNPRARIEEAIQKIQVFEIEVVKLTKIIETKPVEFESSFIFCNIAIEIKTVFSPIVLLQKLKSIERDMGRISDSSVTQTYTDRVIDIDIVYYDAICFLSSKLRIPHTKHVFDRDFSKALLHELLL